MELLLELLDSTSESSPDVKASLGSINKIAMALFGKSAGPVKDPKRSKKPKFFGVAHAKSIFKDQKDDTVKLTFDNSTDSGEFEINSLVPLKIAKGSELDREIKKLYKEHKVNSKKKTNYIVSGDATYLREVHLGKNPHKHAVALVKDMIKLISSNVSRELKEAANPALKHSGGGSNAKYVAWCTKMKKSGASHFETDEEDEVAFDKNGLEVGRIKKSLLE